MYSNCSKGQKGDHGIANFCEFFGRKKGDMTESGFNNYCFHVKFGALVIVSNRTRRHTGIPYMAESLTFSMSLLHKCL